MNVSTNLEHSLFETQLTNTLRRTISFQYIQQKQFESQLYLHANLGIKNQHT